MKGDKKYLVVMGISFGLYILFQVLNPPPIDWTITLSNADKNPFGAYILDDFIPDLFPESDYEKSYLTLYEKQDDLAKNQLIISTAFFPDDEDLEVLLDHVYQGGNVLVSAHMFGENLQDTLNFKVEDYLFDANFLRNVEEFDSSGLKMVSEAFSDNEFYKYQRNNAYRRFAEFDTTKTRLIAINDLNQAVTIRIPFGKGDFILNTTPLIFSNFYLLTNNNSKFASETLSLLPPLGIHWAEYYMQGRRESASPIRYILSQPSLEWAYYLLLFALAVYMIVDSKRKQRIIPVISPVRNSTLDFIHTVSSLYFKRKDHRSIAEKRITFFLDKLRTKYFIPHNLEGVQLYKVIAAKSGKNLEDVQKLMQHILAIRSSTHISELELKELNNEIEDFKL